MFLLVFLLAVFIILSVVSLIGVGYFFYYKKTKLGFISLGAFIGFILLIIFLCYFYAFRAPSYMDEKHQYDIEDGIVD